MAEGTASTGLLDSLPAVGNVLSPVAFWLSVRASRQLYHASSDLLCPEAQALRGRPACSVVLDMERMKEVVRIDAERKTVTVGPTLILDSLMRVLEKQGLALDFQRLPFYSNLTMAGMLLTAIILPARPHFTPPAGLWGLLPAVVPLTKLRALARRMHDKKLRSSLSSVLGDKNLVLIQWLPDVMQAIIMTREAVPLSTPGNAVFQVLEGRPLLSALGALTMGVQQVDNALLGDRTVLDDLPLCLAEIVLIPYHRGDITKVPIPFGVPAVGRLPVMATSNCIPNGPGCLWRNIPVNLLEVDLDVADLPVSSNAAAAVAIQQVPHAIEVPMHLTILFQAWMDDVRAIIAKEVPTCLPSVIGFAMRFGQSSRYPMDMAYGRDTAYVDLVSNKGPHLVDQPSAYQHVFDEIEQLTFCKYKARAHWGKNSNRVLSIPRCPLVDKYPELYKVLAAAKQYDPEGVFMPPLLAAVLNRQSPQKTPGCAVRGQCYCDQDVDCGPNYACVPGGTYPEYKAAMKAPSKAAGAPVASLDFKSGAAHGGPGDTCFVVPAGGQGLCLLSCGADGNVCLRDAESLDVKATFKASETGGANIVAAHPNRQSAVVGTDQYAKALKLPSCELERNVARSSLPLRALAYSPDGNLLAVGGDAENVRLHNVAEGMVVRQLKCEGYVRGLAWDPAGSFLAAAQGDGSLMVWNTESGKLECRKRLLAKAGEACCLGLACPCGDRGHYHSYSYTVDAVMQVLAALLSTLPAMLSADNDVVLFERLSWSPSAYLAGGHTKAVTAFAFSPNGLYAASAGEDCVVCVWDLATNKPLAKAAPPGEGAAVAGSHTVGLAWHPTGNALALINAKGQSALWKNCVPGDLIGPAVPMDELAKAADAGKPGAEADGDAGSLQALSEAEDDDDDDDNGEAGDADAGVEEGGKEADKPLSKPGVVARRFRPVRRVPARFGNCESSTPSLRTKPLAALWPPSPEPGCPAAPPSTHPGCRPSAPAGPPPQGPLQPCSTPPAPSGSGPHAGSRYLCYTMQGCVISRPVEDHHVIEVSFHDTRRAAGTGGRVPLLTDFYGFTLGALGERGVAYGCPPTPEAPSMLVYRSFDAWAANSDWTTGLPAGESVVAIAVGQSFLAAATSTHVSSGTAHATQTLRLFTLAGLPTAIITLPGAPVAMAAQVAAEAGDSLGAYLSMALTPLMGVYCPDPVQGQQLAVVTHAGDPSVHTKSQNLHVTVYALGSNSCVLSCPCPLTPGVGALLTWMAFTSEGLLAVGDSTGVLRLRSGLSSHWTGGQGVRGVRGLKPTTFPPPSCSSLQMAPRPFFTTSPLSIASLQVEGGNAALEGEHLLTSIMVSSACLKSMLFPDHRCEAAGGGWEGTQAADELLTRQTEADRCLLKIFQAALKADRQARALEVASLLSLHRSFEGALRLAAHHRASGLADRISLFMQQREEAEQGGRALDPDEMAAAGACTPVPYKSSGGRSLAEAGEDATQPGANGLQHQTIDLSAVTPSAAQPPSNAHHGQAASTPPTTGGVGSLTALKAAAATKTPDAVNGTSGESQPLVAALRPTSASLLPLRPTWATPLHGVHPSKPKHERHELATSPPAFPAAGRCAWECSDSPGLCFSNWRACQPVQPCQAHTVHFK
ncbi:hypothetical protein QJQ45_018035 [Haematococcus lacustris]|nr:hypothetical protein QJQ45_018035 [Haematococcus lacustris]